MQRAHFLLILAGSIFLLSAKKLNPPAPPLTLQEAISKKLVTYTATSNGNYSGNSVGLKLINLTGQAISIHIPNGSYFEPGNPEDQNLILVEDVPVMLAAKETKAVVLDGFCMEASDHSPVQNGKMTLRTNKDEKLKKLCNYLNSHHNSGMDIQSSVWAAADGQPIQYIDNSRPEARALRTEVATITQREDPWYTTVPVRRVTPTRQIETLPVTVKGLMKITIGSADKFMKLLKTKMVF